MTDPIDDAIKAVAKHIGGYIPFNPEAPPFNHGISLHPKAVRRYLDLNAKDAEYMFHEHNIFIGQNVRITGNGTVQAFECTGRSDTDPECAVLQKDGVFHSKTVRFDRLEIVPSKQIPEHPVGFTAARPIPYTQDEATEQLAFLLLQCGPLFEMLPQSTPEAVQEARDELVRVMKVRGIYEDGPDITAALAYYDAANQWHEAEKAKWAD